MSPAMRAFVGSLSLLPWTRLIGARPSNCLPPWPRVSRAIRSRWSLHLPTGRKPFRLRISGTLSDSSTRGWPRSIRRSAANTSSRRRAACLYVVLSADGKGPIIEKWQATLPAISDFAKPAAFTGDRPYRRGRHEQRQWLCRCIPSSSRRDPLLSTSPTRP